MPIGLIFRTAGAWGAGKGSNLTPGEVDANFKAIADALDDLEANPPEAVPISNITQSGSSITVWLEDGTSFGPFTLPTATPLIPVGTIAETTYTLELADRGAYLRCTNVTGCIVTIPADAEVAIPIGSEYYFRQVAVSAVIFDAPSGVTLNGIDGYSDATAMRGAMAMLKKVDTDEWDLCGGLLAEETTV